MFSPILCWKWPRAEWTIEYLNYYLTWGNFYARYKSIFVFFSWYGRVLTLLNSSWCLRVDCRSHLDRSKQSVQQPTCTCMPIDDHSFTMLASCKVKRHTKIATVVASIRFHLVSTTEAHLRSLTLRISQD